MTREPLPFRVENIDDLSDDVFGRLYVQHSDPSLRNDLLWTKISAIEHTVRAHRVVKTMMRVSDLSVLAKKEALAAKKEEILASYSDEDDAVALLSQNREWLLERARFDQGNARAVRFHLRAQGALSEIRRIRVEAGYEDAQERFWNLVDHVNTFLSGLTEEEDLRSAMNYLVAHASPITGDGKESRVWAPCEIMEDGTTIEPRWSDWYDDREQAEKALLDDEGTVLGTAWVTSWQRA